MKKSFNVEPKKNFQFIALDGMACAVVVCSRKENKIGKQGQARQEKQTA
jgi:hypothetical protein